MILAAITISLAMQSGRVSAQGSGTNTSRQANHCRRCQRRPDHSQDIGRFRDRSLRQRCARQHGQPAFDLAGLPIQRDRSHQEQVTTEIQRLASKFGLSMDSYLKLLQEERDITPNQYSREIIWPMLALRRLVADKVEVTPEEFNKAYMSQFGEAVKCRLIMTASHGKANKVLAQAKANPSNFASLAKQFSEDEASMSVGGLIPPIRRYTGDSRLEEAAFALKDNEVSEIMQLGDQWIILQAVRRIPEAHPSPQAMPAIKEQISDRIRDDKDAFRSVGIVCQAATRRQSRESHRRCGSRTKQYPGVAALINGQSLPISQVAEECVKRHGEEVLEGEINRKIVDSGTSFGEEERSPMKIIRSEVSASGGRITASSKKTVHPIPIKWMESVTANSQRHRNGLHRRFGLAKRRVEKVGRRSSSGTQSRRHAEKDSNLPTVLALKSWRSC